MPDDPTLTPPGASPDPADVAGSAAASVSGPSHPASEPDPQAGASLQRAAAVKAGAQAHALARPFNELKASEFGLEHGMAPSAGQPSGPDDARLTGSTVQEARASDKVGDGVLRAGLNATNAALDRVRADSSVQRLTTNQGVPVGDNQNSLKAGLRGPTLMEDFILREKITHFDHERIPERVVHARGSGAHGVFVCTSPLNDVCKADLFAEAGRETPVFVRFSTVAGERGSADAVRDTRGFAVKFYTREGNWDLVGNNMPVFFIQDAMKFPDVVHAVKPEPHHQMPQAASAHDTFWDFVSLMPESMHHVLWAMSDRGIPRSYRTMQGFGVNTYRLVDDAGGSVFVKFHWLPVAGTHSLVWDEAVKINGADPDFHRRDLWESIEAGCWPEYDLAVQLITEEQAASFSFDVLDATKLVPEELVPLRTVGRLTLNRNPDNFFAETEQVAFCVAHVVPGVDFSNDPLLQGRIHSYLDTQLTRLGGPNFHEIPINTPVAQVHNNQRDGAHRQTINRGRVSYEPNSLAGGCPFQAGRMGFVSVPEPMHEDKVRGKPERFADHYSQPRLFFRSQTPVEQRHLANALRFELSRVTVPAIRERVVSQLVNVDPGLARTVADGLGIDVPAAQPSLVDPILDGEVQASPGLSLFARPGDGSIRGRRIALLAGDGCDLASLRTVQRALCEAGATAMVVGTRLGTLRASAGEPLEAETSVESMPSVLWDACVLPDGADATSSLCAHALVLDFVREQYRHAKPILALGAGLQVLAAVGVPTQLEDGRPDPGLVLTPAAERPAPSLATADAMAETATPAPAEADSPSAVRTAAVAGGDNDLQAALRAFIQAVAKHRHFEREVDPPLV